MNLNEKINHAWTPMRRWVWAKIWFAFNSAKKNSVVIECNGNSICQMIRDQSLFMAWGAGGGRGEGGEKGVEEDRRRIFGGSHGFQGYERADQSLLTEKNRRTRENLLLTNCHWRGTIRMLQNLMRDQVIFNRDTSKSPDFPRLLPPIIPLRALINTILATKLKHV